MTEICSKSERIKQRKKSFNFLSAVKLKSACWKSFRAVLILGLGFMILFPFFTRISHSFMTWKDLNDVTVFYIPRTPTLENFKQTWIGLDYPVLFLKSLSITLAVAIFQTVSCTLVSYGLARFKFRGNKLIFVFVLLTLLVPPQLILMPVYLKFRYFNPFQFLFTGGTLSGISLINTMWPLLILAVTSLAFKSGLYIYMLRQFFINLPTTLEEAASIDGCGHFKTFAKIMLPNAVPMIITVFLFAFVWQWNDYNYTSMLASELPTMPMGILKYTNYLARGQQSSQVILSQGPLFFFIISPLVVLYIITQKFFIEGITRSGIVG